MLIASLPASIKQKFKDVPRNSFIFPFWFNFFKYVEHLHDWKVNIVSKDALVLILVSLDCVCFRFVLLMVPYPPSKQVCLCICFYG